jgi:hypothetical protein
MKVIFMEGYLYDELASFFLFECIEDYVLEIGFIGGFLVIEDNTNSRRWFLGYSLNRHI